MPSLNTVVDNGSNNDEFIVKSKYPSFDIPPINLSEHIASFITGCDPNLVALIDSETKEQLTYEQLHLVAQEVANSLIQQQVDKKDLILFFGENSMQHVISMLASLYLGVTFSPITPANGAFEFTQQCENSGGTVLFVSEEKLPVLYKVMNHPDYSKCVQRLKLLVVMNVDQLEQTLVNSDAAPKTMLTYGQLWKNGKGSGLKAIPHYATTPNDHLMIVYTSGTTGLPKGAIHSHRSMLACLLNAKTKTIPPGMKFSLWYPLGHISGTMYIMFAFQALLTTILHVDNNLEKVLAAVEQYKINMMSFSPAHAIKLATVDYHKKFDLSSLKVLSHGGSKTAENILQQIKQKYRVMVQDKYGATEFLGSVGYDHTNMADGVGKPLSNVEMKIVDIDTGKSLPPNEHGEICFRGPPCFVGYLNNEQATKATIDQDGWYHSGDIGYYDPSGELHVVDRIKELIKYKMWSIAPVEIEDFLHRHPAVASCCVVGVKHVSDGELIRAYVQLAKGQTVTEEELVKHVQDNMGFQKRLRGGVRFVDQFPRTVIGKVDRQHFKKLIKSELITDSVE